MNIIITMIDSDDVGIIARFFAFLPERNINIVDISLTMLRGNLVMLMRADLSSSAKAIEDVKRELAEMGGANGCFYQSEA